MNTRSQRQRDRAEHREGAEALVNIANEAIHALPAAQSRDEGFEAFVEEEVRGSEVARIDVTERYSISSDPTTEDDFEAIEDIERTQRRSSTPLPEPSEMLREPTRQRKRKQHYDELDLTSTKPKPKPSNPKPSTKPSQMKPKPSNSRKKKSPTKPSKRARHSPSSSPPLPPPIDYNAVEVKLAVIGVVEGLDGEKFARSKRLTISSIGEQEFERLKELCFTYFREEHHVKVVAMRREACIRAFKSRAKKEELLRPFSIDQWDDVKYHLRQYRNWNCEELSVDFTLNLSPEKPIQIAPSASTQTKSKQRGAVGQQLAIRSQNQQVEAAAGRRHADLVVKWKCDLRACRNYGKLCYSSIGRNRDIAHNHYVIDGEAATRWLREVRDGSCDIDRPPDHVLWALEPANDRRRGSKKRKSPEAQQPTQSTPQFPNPYGFTWPWPTPFGPPPQTPTPTAPQVPQSSPVQPRGDAADQITRFIAYCKALPSFARDIEELTACELALNQAGHDLENLRKEINMDWWERKELREGLLSRLKREIKGFIVVESTRMSSGSTDPEEL